MSDISNAFPNDSPNDQEESALILERIEEISRTFESIALVQHNELCQFYTTGFTNACRNGLNVLQDNSPLP